MWVPPWLGPPEVFKSDLSTQPPSIHQLQVSFSCPDAGSCRGFCLWISAKIRRDSLYLPFCLSNFWGSGLSYDLTSMTDLRIVVKFSVFSDFYLLLGWSTAFKFLTCCTGNWKNLLTICNCWISFCGKIYQSLFSHLPIEVICLLGCFQFELLQKLLRTFLYRFCLDLIFRIKAQKFNC